MTAVVVVVEEEQVLKGGAAGVLKEVWAGVRASCRALFLDITKGAGDSLRCGVGVGGGED